MKKGRNKELIKKRDRALCRRYVILTECQHLYTSAALKIIAKEFFLTEERIYSILRRDSEIVGEYLENYRNKSLIKQRSNGVQSV
jgi:hypothetical protein